MIPLSGRGSPVFNIKGRYLLSCVCVVDFYTETSSDLWCKGSSGKSGSVHPLSGFGVFGNWVFCDHQKSQMYKLHILDT